MLRCPFSTMKETQPCLKWMSYKPYRRTDKRIMQRSNPQYRVHTSLGAVIQGKPTIARSITLDVCTDEGTLEEPRATSMRAEMVGYIKQRADTKQYSRLAPVHLTRNNNNHVCQANPMENSTECKSATTLVSSQHRVHTAIEAAIPSKQNNARNMILQVCADESALEEPRATRMREKTVRYIKRRTDTTEYLRLAPVTDQGRCCAAPFQQ